MISTSYTLVLNSDRSFIAGGLSTKAMGLMVKER